MAAILSHRCLVRGPLETVTQSWYRYIQMNITIPEALSRICLVLSFVWLAVNSAAATPQDTAARPVLVYTAASLTDAMQEIGADYERKTHLKVKMSFAASSNLARQIEAGAPADVFFSADTDWMDYLQKRALIQAASRRNLLGNELVLIAPVHSPITLRIAPHFALAAALGSGHLATGDPDLVPVGRYARAALTTLGVWNEVEPRIARAENVRVALMYVARGEAPLGIVYSSDARIDKGVRVVDTFPADTHPPIVYPIALTRAAQADAAKFLSYVVHQGRGVFARYGFTVLTQ
jgi:molybdate transport system substrate-binding protein